MIDLMNVFKRDGKTKPEIVAVVVKAQANQETQESVRKSIADAGFKTDTVTKAENEQVVIYKQNDYKETEIKLVRLSEEVVLAVKGLSYMMPDDGSFEDLAKANGIYSSFSGALDALYSKGCDILCDAETPSEAASKINELLDEFKGYVSGLVSSLPEAAFKMDKAVVKILHPEGTVKATKEESSVSETTLNGINDALTQAPKSYTGATDWTKMSPVDKIKWMQSWFESNAGAAGPGNNKDTIAAAPQGGVEDKVSGNSAVKEEVVPPAAEPVEKKEVVAGKAKDKKEGDGDLAPTGTEAGKGGTTEKVVKDENFEKLMAAITTLSTEVATIKKSQEEQQKTVDTLAQKSETLEQKLEGTVIAAAPPADSAAPGGEPVRKSENDPRSAPEGGSWDTAMIRKSDRRRVS